MDTSILPDVAILLVRVVVGVYVAAHGAQKLFGWFGGQGIRGSIAGLGRRLGFRPAPLWVTTLVAAEAGGGVLMAIGLLGALGPVAVAAAMLGATAFSHWTKGPWIAKGGYELVATNLAVALAVAMTGVGRFSIDAWLGIAVPGPVNIAFAALAFFGVLAAGLSRRTSPVQG